ncbi:HAD family hydrolase [Alistipes sp.]|uniref:HAD family hydrolase n=1 Tax=Alistipes sp. TaxID=1872444 RepID=UPI003AEFB6F4
MMKGALFDMDGTLVDNTPAHMRSFELFCNRYGVRDWREKLSSAFGMGNEDIMRLIMPEEVLREKGFQALAEEKEAIYREIYAPEIEPVAGLVRLLERLREAGIRCAVGSSGCKANVDFVLEKCGIGEFFDTRISGDMVSRCKPDPEIYLAAAAALGLHPDECIVFEDAPAGIESARRAGAGRIVALATTLGIDDLNAVPGFDLAAPDYRWLLGEKVFANLING